MKIALLSDTHIPASAKGLPAGLIEQIRGAELILHGGDLTELSLLEELKKIAPTEAVVGNMDSPQVRRALPEKKILKIGNFRIGLIHGWGSSEHILDYVKEKFKDEMLDCIVYGHSHRPSIDKIDNTIYFNPGSPTEKIFAPYNSFGILEVGEKVIPTIIRL